MRTPFRLLFLIAALALCVRFSGSAAAQDTKDGPFPPHRIAGNLYYVGSQNMASYLIATEKGLILINSSFAETVPLIQAAVEKLGFHFKDVKMLLTSHAHSDHVAGSALVRRLTGARVLVMEGDEDIVRTGGKDDFQYTETWEPCPVDKVLHDREKVSLGGSTLTAWKTAGHTKGCTTWTMDVMQDGKTYKAVIIGSPNVNTGYKLVGNTKYPGIAEDFAKTFKTLKSLPCDLFLGAHGAYYGLPEKYERLQKDPKTNPFVDPQGYLAYVTLKQKAFEEELARQKAGK